jgi:hypothetical protein
MSETMHDGVSINREVFERMESGSAGLFALADLMRAVNQERLEECTFDGIAQLLGVVATTMMDAVLDGYGLGEGHQMAAAMQEAKRGGGMAGRGTGS